MHNFHLSKHMSYAIALVLCVGVLLYASLKTLHPYGQLDNPERILYVKAPGDGYFFGSPFVVVLYEAANERVDVYLARQVETETGINASTLTYLPK